MRTRTSSFIKQPLVSITPSQQRIVKEDDSRLNPTGMTTGAKFSGGFSCLSPSKRYQKNSILFLYTFIIVLITFFGMNNAAAQTPRHTFTLGENDFLLDGKPFQIISGELHYARIPKEYWRHRLQMAKAMGLNTIATYIFWNYHEATPGVFDFKTENRNVAEFIKLAQEEGLWVIVRPGPYVCAEWEFGGYPAWLLKEGDLQIRSKDERFLSACERYLKRFGEEAASLQITKGGPVIMVQVENEYGSYGDDKKFMERTRDYIKEAGFDVPLFTADGPTQCKNGYVSGVLPGINGDYNASSVKDTVKKYHGGVGPFFVPEFYTGWVDHWGEKKSIVPVEGFIGMFDTLLQQGVSINLFMFHGGTSFGFMSGANYGGKFQPQPTSYDYDAPLDEAGRPTPKYFKFRETILKRLPAGMVLPEVPQPLPVVELLPISLNKTANLFEALPAPVQALQPLAMEELGQSYGYTLYRTTVGGSGEMKLVFKDLRDYATVYLDLTKIASMDRRHKQRKLMLELHSSASILDILVENGGRLNYGRQMVDNRKGILGEVTLDGKELTNWEIYPFPLENLSNLKFEFNDALSVPTFFRGSFLLGKVGDTFLDMRGWGKGVVWVNGHNLGRFWYIGHQQTLYLPGVWLKEGENEITVLDIEDQGQHIIRGLKEPILNQLVEDELTPPLPTRVAGALILNQADIVSEGSFLSGDSAQTKMFKPTTARYICLQSLSSLRDDPFASIGELYLLDNAGKLIDRESWSVYAVDSEELKSEDGRAENAFDDDVESIWHTQWGEAKPPHPHAIAIDLGKEYSIAGFQYQPRIGNSPGKIKDYKFYLRVTPFEMK